MTEVIIRSIRCMRCKQEIRWVPADDWVFGYYEHLGDEYCPLAEPYDEDEF